MPFHIQLSTLRPIAIKFTFWPITFDPNIFTLMNSIHDYYIYINLRFSSMISKVRFKVDNLGVKVKV